MVGSMKGDEEVRQVLLGYASTVIANANDRICIGGTVDRNFHVRSFRGVANGIADNIFERSPQHLKRSVHQTLGRVREGHRAIAAARLVIAVRSDSLHQNSQVKNLLLLQ